MLVKRPIPESRKFVGTFLQYIILLHMYTCCEHENDDGDRTFERVKQTKYYLDIVTWLRYQDVIKKLEERYEDIEWKVTPFIKQII